jgi:hypothetical protein
VAEIVEIFSGLEEKYFILIILNGRGEVHVIKD